MKTHLLTTENRPGACGVGQGRRLGTVRGYTFDQIRYRADLQAEINCRTCAARARARFPADVDLLGRKIEPR